MRLARLRRPVMQVVWHLRVAAAAAMVAWVTAALPDCSRTHLGAGRGGAGCILAASVEGSGVPLLWLLQKAWGPEPRLLPRPASGPP